MKPNQESNPFETKDRRLRFVIVAIFIFFLFAILIVQFFRIQVLQHEKWVRIAKGQHQTVVREPFKRGVFYSNTTLKKGHPEEKQPFVVNVLHYHLFIDPMLIPAQHRAKMKKAITSILDLKTDIGPHFEKKSRSRRVAMWLTMTQKDDIEKWWKDYAKMAKLPRNALYLTKDFKRSYPFGKMLGQVLHTVRDERNIETNQAIPTGGLEEVFDKYLRGQEGKKVILRAPRYELDFDSEYIPPVDGADVYLTINHILQAICEEELSTGIKKVSAAGGWAVMMDPFTGEILAMAQDPPFDPENYRDYYNDPNMVENTRSKSITDCFEPGSTMKAISISIALVANEELINRGEEPLFVPNEMVRCDQNMFPGRTQPLFDGRTHKYLNMYMALQKSSNVYPAKLIQKVVERLGKEWYRQKLVEIFGFGCKSGFELPYENPGLVPDPNKTYANGALQWSAPTPYSLAIGYNLNVNAVQMVRAFSVFANGGFLVQPTIVKKIMRGDEVLLDNEDRSRSIKRVISGSIASEITYAMKYAIKTGGSAPLAAVPGFTVVGKTGTSEKLVNGKYSKSQNFASFLGFAPVSNPRFVLFVGIDDPKKIYIPGFGMTQFGGKCAAPVFREITKRALEYLGESPDDPYGFPKGDPRFDEGRADWNEEVKQLSEVYEQWNEGSR